MIRTLLQKPLIKIAAVPVAAALSWWANDWYQGTATTPSLWLGGSVPLVGSNPRTVEKEFVVAGAYQTQAGLFLLNSSEDYTDPQSITAVVSPKRLPAAGTDAQALVGRTIRVKGRPSTYKGRPQILVDAFTIK